MKLTKNIIGLTLGTLLMFAISVPVAFAGDLMIIANQNVAEDSLSPDDVQKIYSGKKTKWSDNATIVLSVLDGSDTHKAFLKQFVKKSPSQFKMTWKKMVFTGKGTSPEKFKDMKGLVDFVAKTDGAIGYITPEFKTDAVKVIAQ